MRYLLLIHTDEGEIAQMPPEELGALVQQHIEFQGEAESAGVYLGGDRLCPTPTATTVRVRDGEVLTTDGPFAETKEALGGYYLIDVPDLDQALRWAGKIPSARLGCVEVRPIWDMSENGAG